MWPCFSTWGKLMDCYLEPRDWDIRPWMLRGLCNGTSVPDLWFPEHAGRGADPRVKMAKAICASCPVRLPCLDYALSRGERGIWGGTTEDERRLLRKTAS